VYKQGRRHFAAHMTVFYLQRGGGDDNQGTRRSPAGPRIGFTVGKVLGGAVLRNRMKRRLREAVRLQDSIPVAVDVVINPKKSLLATRFEDLQSEVAQAFGVILKSSSKKSVVMP
jgi:ribonuclease P protein component